MFKENQFVKVLKVNTDSYAYKDEITWEINDDDIDFAKSKVGCTGKIMEVETPDLGGRRQEFLYVRFDKSEKTHVLDADDVVLSNEESFLECLGKETEKEEKEKKDLEERKRQNKITNINKYHLLSDEVEILDAMIKQNGDRVDFCEVVKIIQNRRQFLKDNCIRSEGWSFSNDSDTEGVFRNYDTWFCRCTIEWDYKSQHLNSEWCCAKCWTLNPRLKV